MAIIVLAVAAVWTAHHTLVASAYDSTTTGRLSLVWTALFVVFMVQTLMYHLEHPRRLSARGARQLSGLHVAILMPVHNEDPGCLKLGLESFLTQTRRPDSVHIVDDGSTSPDYAEVRAWWNRAAPEAGVAFTPGSGFPTPGNATRRRTACG
ncbi:glycosyltransferase family A protein [Streptomyces sp. Wb2n-11]|uniref:glycosyltransferase family A protein n=1 Tax=Streptomyces sp. Wb2n-11 TaxID=1030533 RepID=UPI002100140F|nr:hypothetical protein [Streptomyces sp. Wb2n-11]